MKKITTLTTIILTILIVSICQAKTVGNKIDLGTNTQSYNKCMNASRMLMNESFKDCIEGPFMAGRLTYGECVIWSTLDYNDSYYSCIIESSKDKFE